MAIYRVWAGATQDTLAARRWRPGRVAVLLWTGGGVGEWRYGTAAATAAGGRRAGGGAGKAGVVRAPVPLLGPLIWISEASKRNWTSWAGVQLSKASPSTTIFVGLWGNNNTISSGARGRFVLIYV